MALRRRRLRPDRGRFIGWLPDLPEPALPPVEPDLTFDVIRSRDLVVFRVEAYGAALIGGRDPIIRWTGEGHLVVGLPFQHLAERAIYESKVELPNVDEDPLDPDSGGALQFQIPEVARPAKPSRVVLSVPDGYEVPFTVAGVLRALARLPMAVHPLARPRSSRATLPDHDLVIGLADGVVGLPTAAGLIIATETTRRRGPDTETAAGLAALARHRRIARGLIRRLGAVPARGVDLSDAVAVDVDVAFGGTSARAPGLIGIGGLVPPIIDFPRPRRPTLSRPPEQFETAIEAPYRLIVSPSRIGGWSHATEPVGAEDSEDRVELWHSRLGVRVGDDGRGTVDESTTHQRVIRAVWARDREGFDPWPTDDLPHDTIPFRTSLDRSDRNILVRQSSETWVVGGQRVAPEPVDVRRLALSSLGAWLDLHGAWETEPYTPQLLAIESWDHVAPMGRDQFVKVVYPGFLWPFGHRASLVKLTERKMKTASPSVAGLYQRKFLVIKEPVRRYDETDVSRRLPLTEVRIVPLVTPTLDPEPSGQQEVSAFVPLVDNSPFEFVLHCRDHEDRAVRLVTPLTWVSASFVDESAIRTAHQDHATIGAFGQKVAFAPVSKGGDTVEAAETLTFDGTLGDGTSTPHMQAAEITVDVVERMAGVGTVPIVYHHRYAAGGFEGQDNVGEVWAEVVGDTKKLEFGTTEATGTDRAGGFIQPNLIVEGLSRTKGVVNDLDRVAGGTFKADEFLKDVLPKLFGLVPLTEILDLDSLDLSEAPTVVSQTLGRVEGFMEQLERAENLASRAIAEADALVDRANGKAAELQQQAAAALTAAQDLATELTNAIQAVLGALQSLVSNPSLDPGATLAAPMQAIRDVIPVLRSTAAQLPPLVGRQLENLADVLGDVVDAVDLIDDVVRWISGLEPSETDFTYRYEWTPKLHSWPANSPNPVLKLEERSLVIAVEGRLNGQGEMGVEALAELKDFSLNLLPGAPLIQFDFDHLSFLAGSDGKTEVDVVLSEIRFVGILGFIEVLRDLIPFDGFSDPPYLDVSPAGLKAGFTQDLPNVAIGVFNLSNLSLAADVQVPFLGEMVTVGFSFCSRERPFTLAVLFIGGGGFFAIRLSPERVEVLELALEAGAVLAVDFGVASGSVSAMLGIYMRLEGDAGSLAGYFRLRGEVDVLGLISASIELYLELNYDFDTGKMVGSASLTVKVEVLFFSTSVTIRAERQFAGSNGDPNFLDVMEMDSDGSSPAWTRYCRAFAEE